MPPASRTARVKADTVTPPMPSRKDDVKTFATPKERAPVVSIQDRRDAPPGYREVRVRAVRDGYYELTRRRGPKDGNPGDEFVMAVLGDGELPTWVEAVDAPRAD